MLIYLLWHLQKDEMDMEHLATLERLRQSQRQDYLKVRMKKSNTKNSKHLHRKHFLARIITNVHFSLSLSLNR